MSADWDKQEKRIVKRRGGKQTKGSGSSWRNKSDVVEPKVRWEMKSTGERSISLKAETWHKIRKEAILSGRMPAMHLQIGHFNPTRLVVISEDDFDEAFPSEPRMMTGIWPSKAGEGTHALDADDA